MIREIKVWNQKKTLEKQLYAVQDDICENKAKLKNAVNNNKIKCEYFQHSIVTIVYKFVEVFWLMNQLDYRIEKRKTCFNCYNNKHNLNL